MKKSEIEIGVRHIFESGANEIRIVEFIETILKSGRRPFYFYCEKSQSHVVDGGLWDSDSLLLVYAPTPDLAVAAVNDLVGGCWHSYFQSALLVMEEFKNGVCAVIYC